LETYYGLAWSKAGIGSHNFGAVQCCKPTAGAGGAPTCPANAFLYTDTHPNSNGTSTSYSVCFRAYPSDVDGAKDFLDVLLPPRPAVANAIASGSAQTIAEAMYETHYYEGAGKTPADRIARYAKAIAANAARIAAELGEPALVT